MLHFIRGDAPLGHFYHDEHLEFFTRFDILALQRDTLKNDSPPLLSAKGNSMKKPTFLLCLLFCLFAAGCSGNKRLTGKVTFDDGSPAPNGSVILEKDNHISRGEIHPDGTYRVSSEGENDGIPPGEYKVYVTGVSEMPPQMPGMMIPPTPLCEPKYTNPDTSGLTCKIPAPGNRFDFSIGPRRAVNY